MYLKYPAKFKALNIFALEALVWRLMANCARFDRIQHCCSSQKTKKRENNRTDWTPL